MTDDIFMLALTSQRTRNVLKVEATSCINIGGTRVDYAEITLAESKGNPVLVMKKVRITTLVLFSTGIEGFRVEFAKRVEQNAYDLLAFFRQPMLASVR